MSETQPVSPIGEQIAELQARIEQQRQKAHDLSARREAAKAKATEAEAMVALGEARESKAWQAHSERETLERVEAGAIEAIAILERRLAVLRESEPEIIRKQNQRTNVRASLAHHGAQLAGRITDVADVFEDGRAANIQLAQIERDLEALGDPSAGTVLAAVEPPPTLPLALWIALAPKEAKTAVQISRMADVLRERMARAVQSSAPDRYAVVQELSNRISQADQVLSALAAGAPPVETPMPAVMPDYITGESGQMSQAVAVPMGTR